MNPWPRCRAVRQPLRSRPRGRPCDRPGSPAPAASSGRGRCRRRRRRRQPARSSVVGSRAASQGQQVVVRTAASSPGEAPAVVLQAGSSPEAASAGLVVTEDRGWTSPDTLPSRGSRPRPAIWLGCHSTRAAPSRLVADGVRDGPVLEDALDVQVELAGRHARRLRRPAIDHPNRSPYWQLKPALQSTVTDAGADRFPAPSTAITSIVFTTPRSAYRIAWV